MADEVQVSAAEDLVFPVEIASELPNASQALPEKGASRLSADRLLDLGALYQALSGDSVVDTSRSYFQDRATVERFLRLCCFDTDNPLEMAAVDALRAEAVTYLTEIHGYQLPVEVAKPKEIYQLFLAAGQGSGESSRFAGMILKVMHILYHISSRELVFNMRVSEAELLSRLNGRVFKVIDEMRAQGITVCEFAAGKKRRSSITTKLLAKRDTVATHIFDKLRFRIVVKSREDLLNALVHIMRNLLPFNFVMPGQSENGIITLQDVTRSFGVEKSFLEKFWGSTDILVRDQVSGDTHENEFSGPGYRCVNFVAEIPLRLDDMTQDARPAIGSVETEIQLVDATTEQANTQGENSHHRYKARQRVHVRSRLEGINWTGKGLPRFEDVE